MSIFTGKERNAGARALGKNGGGGWDWKRGAKLQKGFYDASEIFGTGSTA
jgi:hypothetical protein